MIPADLIRAIDVLLTLPKRMPQPTLAAPDFEVATYPTWLPFPMRNSLAPKMTGWPNPASEIVKEHHCFIASVCPYLL